MPLSKRASLSLDLLRVATASAVVVYHTAWLGLVGGALPFMTPKVGHTAVIVFFVLSGFVIAASTRAGSSAIDYAIKRVARVYSVVLPALLLVLALSYVSNWLGVVPADAYELRQPAAYFGLHMVFGGDLWTLAIPAFGIGPYWSLNYEVWYYIIFGVAFFTPGAARFFATAAVLLLAGPKIVILFPAWLLGVAIYHLSQRYALPKRLARGVAPVSLLLLIAFAGSAWDDGTDAVGLHVAAFLNIPLRFSQWFVGDYIRCIPTAALIYSLCSAEIGWPAWLARWGKRLAEVSFSLYLLHYPLMQLFRSAVPGPMAAVLAVAVALCFGAVFEPQRHRIRRVLVGLLRSRVAPGT